MEVPHPPRKEKEMPWLTWSALIGLRRRGRVSCGRKWLVPGAGIVALGMVALDGGVGI